MIPTTILCVSPRDFEFAPQVIHRPCGPAGLRSSTPAFSQSWNRYAYLDNNPANGELVTFKDGPAVLATTAITGGVAKFTTVSLSLGVHNITAGYAGNAKLGASTSPIVAEKIKSH